MTETYIHGMLSTNDSHLDGITRRAGTGPLNVLRSRIAIDYSDSGGFVPHDRFVVDLRSDTGASYGAPPWRVPERAGQAVAWAWIAAAVIWPLLIF